MRSFSALPTEIISSFWRNRSLANALIWREVIGRYRGSMLGILWSFFHPVFMLAVYTFVFSVIFKARWNLQSDSKIEFALVLFTGLLVHGLFSECANRAPSLIISNANYVKKVVFPLEILPWVTFGAAFIHMLISLTVWLIFYLIFMGMPSPTVLLLPVVVIPLILFTLGVSWFLASLGVYLRDTAQLIGIVTTILLFLSPIFYPISALPVEYRPLMMLNPLTPTIEMARDVLVWGNTPDWQSLGTYSILATVTACLGFAWFQKTRKGFPDVI